MPELTIVALSILERYLNNVRYANADVSPSKLPFGNLLLFTLIYNYHLLPTSSRFSVHTPLWHSALIFDVTSCSRTLLQERKLHASHALLHERFPSNIFTATYNIMNNTRHANVGAIFRAHPGANVDEMCPCSKLAFGYSHFLLLFVNSMVGTDNQQKSSKITVGMLRALLQLEKSR